MYDELWFCDLFCDYGVVAALEDLYMGELPRCVGVQGLHVNIWYVLMFIL